MTSQKITIFFMVLVKSKIMKQKYFTQKIFPPPGSDIFARHPSQLLYNKILGHCS
eukprot:UN08514